MKGFGNFIDEVTAIGNVTTEDLRLLRMGMKEELKAVNKYEKAAEEATSEAVSRLFLDIAREEKVHVGEFEELLERLDPDYEEAEEEGEKEIEDMLGKE